MITAENVRSKFIDFFVKYNHHHVNSSSLIPHNDPSLLFVNSGMVQFKNLFTNKEQREYKQAVSYQKCLRAGGKHNDLENVGYTARHHTFFEMLGNFSFSSYFKEEAIWYGWEVLTKEYCLPKERLYITVYHDDLDAIKYWKKITGFSEERIIKISSNDNFWSMGSTGPCGPCTEVFFDHGEKFEGGLPGSKNSDGDRYIEIWNMVFMQFEQLASGDMINLPQKSIDTGMGLERMTAILQNVHNNYEIDLFKDLISYIADITRVNVNDNNKFSYHIIADHLRAIAFLIADGIMPANEGRGYVLRRIMRRAIRHVKNLNYQDSLLHQLLPQLIILMGSSYPELSRAEELIAQTMQQEEEKFNLTLEKGLKLLNSATNDLINNKLSGEIVFKLYDTYGFPIDLVEDILKPKSIVIDYDGFKAHMDKQKALSRKHWVGSDETKSNDIWFNIYNKYGATEFLGYNLNKTDGKILAIISKNIELGKANSENGEVIIITNQTVFYGESGGQVGDIGIIYNDKSQAKVIDTKKYLNKLHAHKVIIEEGACHLGDVVTLEIDESHRHNLRIHHTATHILHAALKAKLGNHVIQKGSLVEHNRLRFDFNYNAKLSSEDITDIENQVNNVILNNSKLSTSIIDQEKALSSGAIGLFGEKYEDTVRVVTIGASSPYSKELCAGTHVAYTGDIGSFKIVNESSIASGIRRIEAVSGQFALNFSQENDLLLKNLSDKLKVNKTELVKTLDTIIEEKKLLTKQIYQIKIAQLSYNKNQLENIAEKINDLLLLCKIVDENDNQLLRIAAENTTKIVDNVIVVYAYKNNENFSLILAVSRKISDKYPAKNLVNYIIELFGGKGGGSSTIAQLGNCKNFNLNKVTECLINYIRR